MNTTCKKLIAGGLVALTMGAAVAASSTPAAAYWPHHHWGAGAFFGGLIGGLAVGALAAGAAAGPYGDCYVTRQPVYDDYGNFMGYRPAQVCD
jgi:hypothetical protein